ncbi:SLOG domain-containing protein [Mycolicibacterium brisbanense]|uniref:Uncharacterized protein n=1 Tax=Mycolicibacterium brisbanense TaxID=146020 RepID=A0A100W3A4_9MYCO|nr:hypothetical protein [Mycolicibacterium brisbanense]MCV7156470.1 hypothetical protein [Mycolicibacterium brisbanense]GAS90711.1 uncharacterized protein RMCB_4807 [Mycolicibacterium brisbanense]
MSDTPIVDVALERKLAGRTVFLSASIPNPARWPGPYDPLEITDAVVAVGRAILSAGARLATAAHPTIAPLLLYIAAELPERARSLVIVYQSEVFEGRMPEAISRFNDKRIGIIIPTPAAPGEPPDPAQAPESLAAMRRQLLNETQPDAAIFIGGMNGIPAEYDLFREQRPSNPTYALGYPGGAARELAKGMDSPLQELLYSGTVYPTIARAIVDDIEHRAPRE